MRIEARVDRVTVFERGARITRLATVPGTRAGALPSKVIAAGLPLGLIDDSVRVTARGAIATMATVILEAPGQDPALAEPDASALRDARRVAAIASGELERLRHEIAAIDAAPLITEPGDHEAAVPWAQSTAARRELMELRQTRLRELRHALVGATARGQECERALAAATDAEQRRSTARSPRTGELRKALVIELEPARSAAPSSDAMPEATASSKDEDLELTIEYAVRGARWAPTYVARFVAGQLTWTVRASLSQQTGEDWRGVALRLSTAVMDGHTALPELAALKLGKRQPAVLRRLRPPPAGVEALFADFDRDLPRLAPPPAPTAPTAPPAPEPEPDRHEEQGDGGARGDGELDLMTTTPFRYQAILTADVGGPPPGSPVRFGAPGDFDDDGEDTKVEAKKSGVAALVLRKERKADLPSPKPAAPAARTMSMMSGPGGPPTGGGGLADHRPRQASAAPARGRPSSSPPPRAAEHDAEYGYGNLVMAGWHHPRRGQLVDMSLTERYQLEEGFDAESVRRRLDRAQQAAERVERAAPPAGTSGDWSHDFDYALEAEGRIDVASDGGWHSVPLGTRSCPVKIAHVAVPREAPEVFRVATADNPFDAPILPGPVDVYDGDRFLVTAAAPMVAPGGPLTLPLGVDPAVKIARNAEYREEVTGMLRGGLRLIHELRLEVHNTSAAAIELELRERIPVSRQRNSDDIAVEVTASQPPWQPWTPPLTSAHQRELRGGYRWRVALAAHATTRLSASYEIRIAGKHELIGGNRREP